MMDVKVNSDFGSVPSHVKGFLELLIQSLLLDMIRIVYFGVDHWEIFSGRRKNLEGRKIDKGTRLWTFRPNTSMKPTVDLVG